MSKYVDTVTLFSKTCTKVHWPLDDLWPQVCWGHMCDSTQGSLCPSPMKIHQSLWIQWPFFQKLEWNKVIDPRWPLTTRLLWSHVWRTLPKDHCVKVPWKYIKACGYSDPFCKNLNQRSLTPRWPLWPHICWGHTCDSTQGSLCPSPMGIHQYMWIQWLILQNTTYYILCTEWVIT